MNKFKLAVIIPCYNVEKYLSKTIESVLNQTFKNFTIFLINNGSSDGSLNVMKKYQQLDKRIKIIKYKKKTSRGKSINDLIRKINFKWFCLLDADDVMFKNKIKTQIKYLIDNPNIKVLSNLATYITYDEEKTYGKSITSINHQYSAFELTDKKKNISIMISGCFFDKKIFTSVGGFRQKFWPCDDTDLFNRISEKKKIIYVLPKILIKYRIHSNSVTTNNFFYSKLKNDWVNDCLIQRINKDKELSFKKFCNKLSKRNIFLKAKNLFDDKCDYYFRKTIIYIIDKKILKIAACLFLSFINNPFRFFQKIYNRF